MTKVNTGGSAFPILQDGGRFPRSEGMTLRDYFAAKAMQAHITASFVAMSKTYASNSDAVNPIIAQASYEMADAMLKAREV